MELIFIFTIILCEICLVNFFEVVKVVRTFGIDAFMDNEVFPVLFGNQGVAAMRTSRLNRCLRGVLLRPLWMRNAASARPLRNIAGGRFLEHGVMKPACKAVVKRRALFERCPRE